MNADGAYATCAEITRSEARNFSYGIRLLPAEKRRAMCAVYAFARRIDDIGDGDAPADRKTEQLAACRADLHRLLDGGVVGDDPVLVALQDAAHRLPIPLAAFDELIDGCQADVDGRRYETFDDLVQYCRYVAGSVGRLSLGIYDPPGADRIAGLADSLGVALQLTNILRDVREDRRNGRVYLPREDIDRFGCTLELDDAGELADPPERFSALIRFEARRARDWYARGLRLLPMLDRRSAACTAAMAGIYLRLLLAIAADPDAIRSRRLSLSTAGKLRVAARALAWGRA
ncbi:MAG TPA: presqualene diphosphate synthase HpnD [Amnibacterium sp.]|jgi:phytoene synthase|nr:presqualene diphosphate synthase HpnD [Amnibacterium sp.]